VNLRAPTVNLNLEITIILKSDISFIIIRFLFECKTLRGIRQELFEEIETVIKSFYPDLAFSELPPFQNLQFLIGDFCLSFNTKLCFFLYQFSKKQLCKKIKERAILIESCVDDQELT
jgi:hypothetical protein